MFSQEATSKPDLTADLERIVSLLLRWERGGGRMTYDKMGAFNFKFSQGILYGRGFTISLFYHCWEERESRIMGFWLGCSGG